MVKLSERMVFAAICALPTFFLLVLLYNELHLMRTIDMKLDSDNRSDLDVSDGQPKQVMKAMTKAMPGTTNQTRTQTTTNQTSTQRPTTRQRVNKFPDLYKYSMYNPNFRTYMEWPPFFTQSPVNPNLAEVWENPIQDHWPNYLKFHYQISKLYLYEDTPLIEDLLHDIATQKIIAVDHHPGGTQFKLIVTFEDGGKALFKPARYPKEQEVNENILYLSDFERHFAEIAAFHLDRLLGFRRVPPTVGRKISITRELYPLSDDDFIKTFYMSPDGNYCFHGTCRMYCDTHHGFCGDPHLIEGSFSAFLPHRDLLEHRLIVSPWKRTYLTRVKAPWEKNDPDFCHDEVFSQPPFNESRRIFDAVDCAIFDYIIGNEDRHNYDEFTVFGDDGSNTLIHMDNGRGFGKSHMDEKSILMPLIQCCVVRLSTFNKLYSLHIGARPLSDLMRESLTRDPLAPVLTEAHLRAMDRRLDKVLLIIGLCIEANNPDIVLLDDMIDYEGVVK